MVKLRCDRPDCEAYEKELDIVEVQWTANSDYNEKEGVYNIPTLNTGEYVLACPYCGATLEEP